MVKDEIKSEYLKTKGAVSTPQYIVQEIIKRTIQKNKLIDAGIENILSVKVLDIACGSGVFAIEAYDYLEDIFRELFETTKHPDFTQYFFVTDTDIIVNLLGKKAIMDNCIFGVDIDPEAVEVAKMSLSLKVVDTVEYLESYNEIGIFGSRILNGIGNNIKCGNSLVESDILEIFPLINDNEEELLNTNIFDWNSEQGFREIFEQKGGFDFIIGNPPYVEVKNYNVDLPYMHLYIKEKFPSSRNGKVDLAIPFVERAIGLLNDTGRVGFIIQKRFFKTDYGEKIREIITNANYLSSIIDFEATTIFKDRMTYVALLMLDKTSPETFTYKYYRSNIELLPSELRESLIPEIAPNEYITFSSKDIDYNPWSFDKEVIQKRSRLLETGCLGDYAKVRVGIQALKNDAYHIKPLSIENGIITGKTHLENSFQIEMAACCSLLPNENFYPYRKDDADTYCIFPYEVINNQSREIVFSEFCRLYPLAGAYLSRNKTKIQSLVQTLPGERWHLFTRANNIAKTSPKVYIPMTAKDTFAAITFSPRHYCDNANVNYVEMPIIDETNLYALSAIINSTIFSVLARSIAMPQAEGNFKFNKQFLEPVPFPCRNFTDNNELKVELAEAAKKIEGLQNKFIGASPNQKRTYATLLLAQWAIVDNVSYQLYRLSEEDIIFFNSRGRNVHRIESIN